MPIMKDRVEESVVKLRNWVDKVMKTKEMLETTYSAKDFVNVDKMKADINEIIDEMFKGDK